jgi:hypothetical protein
MSHCDRESREPGEESEQDANSGQRLDKAEKGTDHGGTWNSHLREHTARPAGAHLEELLAAMDDEHRAERDPENEQSERELPLRWRGRKQVHDGLPKVRGWPKVRWRTLRSRG